MLRLWKHLSNLDGDRITKKIFIWDCTLNCNNWSSEIFQIMDILELSEEMLFDINIDVIKAKTFQKTCETWLENARHKPKLRTYVKFKTQYIAEKYVRLN